MIVGICPVRNEDWILALSLRAMLMWMDAVVVLDHCSTDNTRQILGEVAFESGRLMVLREESPVWEEMRHRQRLLDTARGLHATHIAIVDADEVLTGDLLPAIRDMVYACPPDSTMQLPWLCLRGSKDLVHRSGVWGEQSASMAFVDNPGLHWSSAGRSGYDFHNRPPMGRAYKAYNPIPTGLRTSGLMHMQFVSDRRLRAKQFNYICQELIRWPGRETPEQVRRKYSLAVYGDYQGNRAAAHDLMACPESWWAPYAHLLKHCHPEADPWQLEAARATVAANPGVDFGGDDFGLDILNKAVA